MHIGIIMDGNRRWAKKNLMKSILGHHNGKENLKKILDLCEKKGVEVLTVYALSTENLKNRTPGEVTGLLKLIESTIKDDGLDFIDRGYMAKIMGSKDGLPDRLVKMMEDMEEETYAPNPKVTLQACINYGGRDELVRAIKRLVESGDEITEEIISANLDSGLEPDLIIRTGGDIRTSNFLMWQGAYSEYYFTDVLWPDFDENELDKAIDYLKSTKRNFGK